MAKSPSNLIGNFLLKKFLVIILQSLLYWAIYNWYLVPLFSVTVCAWLPILAVTFSLNLASMYKVTKLGVIDGSLRLDPDARPRFQSILITYALIFIVLWFLKPVSIPFSFQFV